MDGFVEEGAAPTPSSTLEPVEIETSQTTTTSGAVVAATTQSLAARHLELAPDGQVRRTKAKEMVAWERKQAELLAREQKVYQVQSSTAGANSSAFHLYRATRQLERDRIDAMDAAHAAQEALEKNNREMDAAWTEDAAQRAKRAAKRKRRKLNKDAAKGGGGGGAGDGDTAAAAAAAAIAAAAAAAKKAASSSSSSAPKSKAAPGSVAHVVAKPAFANDGSFMAMFAAQTARAEASLKE
jgi:hypothetical protein